MPKKKRPSPSLLRKIGVPQVLIPGILIAATLGWTGWKKLGSDYTKNKTIFPDSGLVQSVTDGDTFTLINGVTVRLVGIDAPANDFRSTQELTKLVTKKRVYLEYDRYQNDKYGRILAWVWTDCEDTPLFLPYDYMHLSGNKSREGLTKNPPGCQKGKLLQEELLKKKLVEIEIFAGRGELKYQQRLQNIK